MQLFVQVQSTSLAVQATQSTSVAELHDVVRDRLGYSDFTLSYSGRMLQDEDIAFEHVPPLGTISLDVPLSGGKVHGSLARAGKVRGQTPKVPQADSAKKLTGRAKRRQQYNRRFNNVVRAGPNRGPNSQSVA